MLQECNYCRRHKVGEMWNDNQKCIVPLEIAGFELCERCYEDLEALTRFLRVVIQEEIAAAKEEEQE